MERYIHGQISSLQSAQVHLSASCHPKVNHIHSVSKPQTVKENEAEKKHYKHGKSRSL